jgi:hypothetical protein
MNRPSFSEIAGGTTGTARGDHGKHQFGCFGDSRQQVNKFSINFLIVGYANLP